MDKRVDFAISLLVILFGVLVLIAAQSIRPTGPVVDPIGPRAFPYMIGAFFIIGGGLTALGRLRAWQGEPGPMVESEGEADEPNVPASATQAWLVMGITLIYAFALVPVGYPVATPLFVAAALRTMRAGSWRLIAVTAVVYTILTYLMFAVLMDVRLPVGPLIDLFRAAGLAR